MKENSCAKRRPEEEEFNESHNKKTESVYPKQKSFLKNL